VPDGSWLLSGIRSRRACGSLLRLSGPAWWALHQAPAHETDAGALAAEVRAAIDEWDRSTVADRAISALVDAVDSAMYWQPPHEEDVAFGLPEVVEALAPVADALAAVAPDWWSAPLDSTTQWFVGWSEPDVPPLSLTGVGARLAEWRDRAAAAESQAADWSPGTSSSWWSTPALSSAPFTTRALPGRGAVGLACVEDRFGWTTARCVPVAPIRPVRIFEVDGPDDWVDLVTRYPFEVTRSRRYDWLRAIGVEGRWLIPDYPAVARDHDGVHVTARGYLTTSGGAHPVGDGHTTLAG